MAGLNEIEAVAVEIAEHRDRAVELLARLFLERDARCQHGRMVAWSRAKSSVSRKKPTRPPV